MKYVLYIALMLTLNVSLVANNNDKEKVATKTLSGKITTTNGEELAGAKLIIKETGETFFSDLDGNFKITIKTDKTYSLSIETIGFQTLELTSNKIGMFTDLSLMAL